ncbi:MAG: TM2 domain-containing protein [Bacteroidales bacterium]|nr:TM2 domain-containing protein [Bacteroidales bacterium]
MAQAIRYIPEADGEELVYLQYLMDKMDDEQAATFTHIYRARRRDPNLILISCLLGFVVIAGIHRILVRQVGMGILYLFTAGLCFIGTIIDAVNYRQLSFEYNRKVAEEVLSMMRMFPK